jgi:type II secretory pathway pseudopilin PulG
LTRGAAAGLHPYRRGVDGSRGASRVEILAVVVILGVHAAVVSPQFARHTGGGRLATLDAQLAEMRHAIERYAREHGGTVPGERDAADPTRASAAPAIDFEKQLTLYSDAAGRTSETASDTFRFGPYRRQGCLPVNPFTGSRTLVAAAAPPSVDASAVGATAWVFVLASGRFASNDADAGHRRR